jgi:hypothetical protein
MPLETHNKVSLGPASQAVVRSLMSATPRRGLILMGAASKIPSN